MWLQNVSREELGNKWPLSTPQVELRCENNLVTAKAKSTIYAVNGSARSAARTRKWEEDISPIWLENPAIPTTRIPITPLIDRGLSLCRGGK